MQRPAQPAQPAQPNDLPPGVLAAVLISATEDGEVEVITRLEGEPSPMIVTALLRAVMAPAA